MAGGRRFEVRGIGCDISGKRIAHLGFGMKLDSKGADGTRIVCSLKARRRDTSKVVTGVISRKADKRRTRRHQPIAQLFEPLYHRGDVFKNRKLLQEAITADPLYRIVYSAGLEIGGKAGKRRQVCRTA